MCERVEEEVRGNGHILDKTAQVTDMHVCELASTYTLGQLVYMIS
jgi:hypothetical protein